MGYHHMVTKGLLIRLQAMPGSEAELERFLTGVIPLVDAEPATTALFAIRFGPSEFGIVNAFPDEAGRQAHITGHAGAALSDQARLLAAPPAIEALEIFASKLPASA
jgi:quinol monooxygenase YgiN